ncbi:type II toxin-antitoxin system RelE/ParE family toxin [Rhizobium puerariae]|uniref:Type II toxin-antitoxin system RelE/ParE family toxin n=1 Tax=Rhizobium puerariae TaxID=1585791 RepID=A0ABV6ARE9_9HYPH
MKALIFTPKAIADIDRIYDYTEDNWGADQAEEYTFGIRDFCKGLAAGEKTGRKIDEIRHGYWALSYNSHFIIYRQMSMRITIRPYPASADEHRSAPLIHFAGFFLRAPRNSLKVPQFPIRRL